MTIEMTDDDIMMIRIRDGKVAKTKQRQPSINVDLDADGRVLDIEVIGVSETRPDQLMAVINEFCDIVPHGSGHAA